MKYRALIVDDERIIVKWNYETAIWLSLDIEPVPAMTGLQALELMEQYRFDLIITDIRMPEMDGFDVLRVMQCYAWQEEIPVIVISAAEDTRSVERAYDMAWPITSAARSSGSWCCAG